LGFTVESPRIWGVTLLYGAHPKPGDPFGGDSQRTSLSHLDTEACYGTDRG
jgi:hypothetical protein